ncbi:ABC transporter ATP-binding protein [Streptomyces sp. WZ.A104]|uniref:ABC transporter ATP-binding protein n=1 Tax=Streptomyces durocortorensis TaxID=2811104 RepID=A0ABY9W667_9ACTN|nr:MULTISPECIES: ABC transporter ATP-binding protein [Streptomyces]PCG84118.1 ABC transporter ATP-binding protein [Streptomyces sp. WZ.A104]WNF31305.1 ABC transporter ATP-binding protein [Streptomyces durocortorensis]
MLEVEGLCVEVPGRSLLDDVDLTLRSGESVAVTGPSGSGKSTLLMCLLGLDRPTAGRVKVAGADVTRMRPRKLAGHRRAHIGTIFQFGELLPELTPVENVAVAALLSGARRSAAFEQAASLLARLGVSADTVATSQLSGGERQRTAVARALINKPSLLLADEPTGALDERNRESVSDLLFGLPKETGCGLLVVTHDAAVAARADRTVRLVGGRLTEAVA